MVHNAIPYKKKNEDICPCIKCFMMFIGCLIILGVLSSTSLSAAEPDQTGTLWSPYVDWSLENPTYSGNPFDLVASATFTHTASGETRTTEMFYNGGNTWKLRFAGTRTGEWIFITTSADPDLNGLSGKVTINPNPGAYGFVTKTGNKWVRQVDEGGQVKAFIPQFRMAITETPRDWTDAYLKGKIDQAMVTEGFTGVFAFMAANWVDIDSGTMFSQTSRKDPDPRSFEALERLITKVHSAGGVVHIWYVGDCSRNQCIQSGFGSNGARSDGEKRLLRYIAARLGPLPGWIMGYGYDNNEHATTSDLRGWGNYLRDKMGWKHLLGARDQGQNISYTYWPEADWYSRGNWFSGISYTDVVSILDSNINVPHAFDERWWQTRVSEENQRKMLWRTAMAGGASGIWGSDDGSGRIGAYLQPQWFKTHFTFWQERFLNDIARANNLTDGYSLKTPDNINYVFYKENTSSIQMQLSGMSSSQPAIAIDTKKAYEEISLGMLSTTNQTWAAPYVSDWAIAVGGFGGVPSDTTPPTTPQSLNATVQSNSQINLIWQASSDLESGINRYKIYRDSTLLTNEPTTTSFSDTGLAEGATYFYEVSAVNGAGLEGAKSNAVAAMALADTTRPSIVSATASANGAVVVFNEAIETVTASNPGNYSINNGITVSTASLGADLKTVTLTTSTHAEGATYLLTVNNVKDRAANPNLIAANSNVNYTFVAQLLINNLTVSSGKIYEVVQNGLSDGALVYIDRAFGYGGVPSSLNGATYIKTANDDKSSTGISFLTFDVNQNVTVYVAHDDRIILKPSWLSSFADTGQDVMISNVTHSLWQKDFLAGAVVLGGNEGGGNDMYTIIVVPQGTGLPSDTVPPIVPTGLIVE